MAEHLSDEQVDNLVRLVGNIAAEQPYALDELVGTVERIREEAVLAWQATLDKTVDEANRQLAEAKAEAWDECVHAVAGLDPTDNPQPLLRRPPLGGSRP